MSGPENPELSQFKQSFAIMRKLAPLYLAAAIGLVIYGRPPLAAALICAIAGVACGAVQLVAAHYGQRALYVLTFVCMVVTLAALFYLRIPPFELAASQAVAVGAMAVAMQRMTCAYFHKFAFGGVSYTLKG